MRSLRFHIAMLVLLLCAAGKSFGQCSVTVNNASMCAGGVQAVLTASPGATSYSWTPANYVLQQTAGMQEAHIWINTPGDFPITVTATFPGGCTATATATVTVFPLPVITVSPTPAMVCAGGDSIQLVASGATNYEWYPAYGLGSTTGSVVMAAPVLTTQYMVIGTGANGCPGVTPFSITSGQTPQFILVPTAESCGSGSGQVAAYSIGGSNSYSYQWSGPNNFTSTSQMLWQADAGAYSVTVTDPFTGCFNTGTTTVQFIPPPSITVTNIQTSTCGQLNGGASISVSGGTPPYDYLWSNGNTTATLSNVGPGVHYVTVTSDWGMCQMVDSVVVPTTPLPALNVIGTNATCGQSNGTVTATVSNATPGYSFQWNNGLSDNAIHTGLAANTYAVTMTDSQGCTATASATLTNSTPPSLTTVITHTTCGDDNGAINLTVNAGTPPFVFAWSPSGNSEDLIDLAPGLYSVTVTDSLGCSATADITVNASTGPQIAYVVQPAACGNNTGAIDITVTGSGGYVYNWNVLANTEDVSNLAAGNYTVNVTDNAGCLVSQTITVPAVAGPVLDISGTSASCGLENGSVELTISGGTGSFSFNWNNGAFTTQNLDNVPAGTYNVVVTDAYNCTAFGSTILGDSPNPELGGLVSPSLCGTATGSIDLLVSSGTGPSTFLWNDSVTTQNRDDVLPGGYAVTVTDFLGCTATTSFNVNDIAGPEVTLVSIQESGCGNPNGAITISVTGGAPNYTFEWTGGPVTQNISGIANGTYTVTVTDANTCQTTLTVDVVDASVPSLNASVTSATCSQENGAIDLTVTNGTTPYTFFWSTNDTSEDINGLAAGPYDVTVQDALGCEVILQIVVPGTTAPTLLAMASDASCAQNNGSIDVEATGGTQPYTYSWTNNLPNNGNPINLAPDNYGVTVTDFNGCTVSESVDVGAVGAPALSANVTHTTCGSANGAIDLTVTGTTGPYDFDWGGITSEDISNLAANDYTVTVTDNTGCTLTGTYTVNASQAITLSAIASDASCGLSDGSIDLTVSNGTPQYGFNWNNNPAFNTEDLTNIPAGTYGVTVTDANDCSASLSVDVVNPNAPTLVLNVTHASCDQSNGSITAVVNGGTTQYAYDWGDAGTQQNLNNIPGGTYTLTVTDASNCSVSATAVVNTTPALVLNGVVTHDICNASNGTIDLTVSNATAASFAWSGTSQTTEDLQDLQAGTYTVTVTSVDNCIETTSFTVNDIPCAPTVTLTATDATCGLSNGAIDLQISGGAPPFTFAWSNNETTEDIDDLEPNTYLVTVTDDQGNQNVYNAVVGAIAGPSVSIASQTDEGCDQQNGAVNIAVVGGTAPVTFLWSNSSTTQNIANLSANNYSVTVTDGNDCTATASATIVNVPGPSLSFTTTNANCSQAIGAVEITVSGGTAGFTFLWNTGSNAQNLYNVDAGTYCVTVTDALGCTATICADVNATNAPVVSLTPVSATCGSPNGSVTAAVVNGTAPFTYSWTGGGTGPNLPNVVPGSYCVTVMDAIGCTASACATVGNIAGPTASVATTPEACYQANGTATASTATGTAPFTYYWSNSATGQSISGLTTGPYGVTIYDSNGCSANQSFTVAFADAPVVQLTVTPVTCNAGNGLVDITVSGSQPFTFQWSNNATVEDAANLDAGFFDVTVTDIYGCTTTVNALVEAIEPGTIALSGIPASVCEGQSFNVTAGGMSTYAWSPAAQLSDVTGNMVTVTPIVPVTYTVVGTDANGCTDAATFVANPMPLPQVVLTNGPFDGCAPYTVQLQTDTANLASISWFFTNGFSSTDVSPQFTFSPGVFGAYAIAVSPQGCADTLLFPMLVTVGVSPVAAFRVVPIVTDLDVPPTQFQFINVSTQASSYNWTFGDSSDASQQYQPQHQYSDYGTYFVTLIATNPNGCTDTMIMPVVVSEPRWFFVPNLFTPNNDGQNDEFQLYGRNVSSYELRVYDRTGQQVYSGNHLSDPWDGTFNGKHLNTGVYVWWAEVIYDTGKKERRHGDVTLIR